MESKQVQITVCDLRKIYRVPERKEGLFAAVGSLFHRQFRSVVAVDEINFAVDAGEIVGFIGPNGAGKTTTLKMLAGLLYPSSGEVRVEGHVPWERKPHYLHMISLIMANKNNLNWENTALDSFRVLGAIYRMSAYDFRSSLDELVQMLDIEPLLPKLVRNLSLGERMRCELAGALLYRPRVLFLDEPTLGLDISMQLRLRQFLADYNRGRGATMILTSHYMADVTSLCQRVILIDKGKLLHDGALAGLAERMAPFKQIRLTVGDGEDTRNQDLASLITARFFDAVLIDHDERQLTLRVKKEKAASTISALLNELPIIDITVEDPPIEVVIDQVYREGIYQ